MRWLCFNVLWVLSISQGVKRNAFGEHNQRMKRFVHQLTMQTLGLKRPFYVFKDLLLICTNYQSHSTHIHQFTRYLWIRHFIRTIITMFSMSSLFQKSAAPMLLPSWMSVLMLMFELFKSPSTDTQLKHKITVPRFSTLIWLAWIQLKTRIRQNKCTWFVFEQSYLDFESSSEAKY